MKIRKHLSRLFTKVALIGSCLGLPALLQAQERPIPKTVSIKVQAFAFNSAGHVDLLRGLGFEYREKNYHLTANFYRASPVKNAVALYMGAGFESKGITGAGAEFGMVTGYQTGIHPAFSMFMRSGKLDQPSGRLSVIVPFNRQDDGDNILPPVFVNAELRLPERVTHEISKMRF